MAVNPPGPHPIDAEDARIGALYRQAATEEPPQHVDQRIAERARATPDAVPRPTQHWWPGWRVPFAAAAFAVVAGSLVALIVGEGGEPIALPDESPRSRAEDASSPPVGRDATPPPQGRSEPVPAAGSRRAEAMGQREKQDGGLAASPSVEAPVHALPQKSAPVEEGARARGARSFEPERADVRKEVAAPATEPGAEAGAPRPSTPAASPRSAVVAEARRVAPSPALAAKPRAAPAAAASESDPANVAAGAASVGALVAELEQAPPGRWLERVIALRRESRRPEADALLEEFKRRYPDEPLPVTLKDE